MFHYHYYTYNFSHDSHDGARGPIGVSVLARAARIHVPSASDATLQTRCDLDRIVVLRGRLESGRRSSAIAALDRLTHASRRRAWSASLRLPRDPGAWPPG